MIAPAAEACKPASAGSNVAHPGDSVGPGVWGRWSRSDSAGSAGLPSQRHQRAAERHIDDADQGRLEGECSRQRGVDRGRRN